MTPPAATGVTDRRRAPRREGVTRLEPCGIVSRIICLLLPALGACSGETPEQRVELRTRVSAAPAGSFENAWGWTVSVDGAWMSIGALQLLEGEPLGRAAPRSAPWWQGWFIKTAHAHPGHYQEGDVLAEMLEPAGVDLTRVTELGPSQAVTGRPHSGKLVFGAPAAGPTGEAAVVWVAGRAEGEDADGVSSIHHFIAVAGADVAPAEVTGCPFQGGPLRADGAIELRVDPRVWLDQVDFTDLPAGTGQAPTPLAAAPRAYNGFLRGLEKAAAYPFRFVEETR